jgi:hypothetical protein
MHPGFFKIRSCESSSTIVQTPQVTAAARRARVLDSVGELLVGQDGILSHKKTLRLASSPTESRTRARRADYIRRDRTVRIGELHAPNKCPFPGRARARLSLAPVLRANDVPTAERPRPREPEPAREDAGRLRLGSNGWVNSQSPSGEFDFVIFSDVDEWL